MSQKSLFGDGDLPTTTVHQARLQLFQPTRRPRLVSREIQTPWGIGHIVGKTGQAHADVMEAIFKCSHKNRCDSDKNSPTFGAIEILVDPHAIRKIAAGKQGGQLSGQQLDVLLTDLMQVVISLSGNDVYPMRKGHIIDEVIESKVEAPTIKQAIKNKDGKRFYWYIRISPTFTQFIANDLHLYYDPSPIAKLETGIAQAIARHVATHKTQPPGGWHVDTMLASVGVDTTSSVTMRNRRRELQKDADGLKKLGITIENGRIKREGV